MAKQTRLSEENKPPSQETAGLAIDVEPAPNLSPISDSEKSHHHDPEKGRVITYLKTRKAARQDAKKVNPVLQDTTAVVAAAAAAEAPKRPKLRFPNPIKSLIILREKDTLIALIANAIMFAAFYAMNAAITFLFHDIYGYNNFQIGLCYILIGAGVCIGSIANGFILDYNYRRISKKTRHPHRPQHAARPPLFPYRACTAVNRVPAGVRERLRHCELWMGSAFPRPDCCAASASLHIWGCPYECCKYATVTASNNLVRCLFGAGATGVISPMIHGLGVRWCFTLIAFIMAATSPVMLVVIRFGPKWREEGRLKAEARSERYDSGCRGNGESAKKDIDISAQREWGQMVSDERNLFQRRNDQNMSNV
ncbi:MFS multidrug transporter [Blastomyces gilchristii SLH14081]|uniref:MFS multidrug transporter n=1 Tax=Blastomyces gilchristii (strain SLH14081) TaxID=559298 RepID=A0A179UX52_BLAGS|nr:MFS multidrug transporter [Blastomyces gilchristii SLH14081]OAT11631.1 MFS multidrug transporter [Blastomyces gilchristii SLH14081]